MNKQARFNVTATYLTPVQDTDARDVAILFYAEGHDDPVLLLNDTEAASLGGQLLAAAVEARHLRDLELERESR